MLKLTTVIVDDELDARENLREVSSKTGLLDVVAIAENAQNALELIINEQPDLVLLDIQMPINNGFWLADKLRKMKAKTEIIFVTAFDKYAIEAIKYAAFDFLLKPVAPDNLSEVIEKLLIHRNTDSITTKLDTLKYYLKNDKMKVNTVDSSIILFTNEIIYCEDDGNYSRLHMINGRTELISMKMAKFNNLLTEQTFIRINRKTLININYLDDYNKKSKIVILSDILQKYELKANSTGARLLKKL